MAVSKELLGSRFRPPRGSNIDRHPKGLKHRADRSAEQKRTGTLRKLEAAEFA